MDRQKYSIMIFNLTKGQKYKGLKESNGEGRYMTVDPN